MIDTVNKDRGSIFDLIRLEDLEEIKKLAFENKKSFGLAGSLDISHMNLINRIQPTWAGYRGSLCLKKRTGSLSKERLKELVTAFDRV